MTVRSLWKLNVRWWWIVINPLPLVTLVVSFPEKEREREREEARPWRCRAWEGERWGASWAEWYWSLLETFELLSRCPLLFLILIFLGSIVNPSSGLNGWTDNAQSSSFSRFYWVFMQECRLVASILFMWRTFADSWWILFNQFGGFERFCL